MAIGPKTGGQRSIISTASLTRHLGQYQSGNAEICVYRSTVLMFKIGFIGSGSADQESNLNPLYGKQTLCH